MRQKSFVAYFRVSTQKQKNSGLGIEAQTKAVHDFVGRDRLIAQYTEFESGKKNNRVELEKAIVFCKVNNATLVIAKLDRLSRNAAFIMALKDSGIDFLCADMPDANTMTIGIFAVLAQHERELISSRTKAALHAKKMQGFKLGSPENLTADSRRKSILVRQEKALNDPSNRTARELSKLYREKGFSYKKIAETLNSNHHRTRRGKLFTPCSIQRLLLRNQSVIDFSDGV